MREIAKREKENIREKTSWVENHPKENIKMDQRRTETGQKSINRGYMV
jgi:hypothetical protein